MVKNECGPVQFSDGNGDFSRRGFLGRFGQRVVLVGAALAGVIYRPKRAVAQRPPGNHPFDTQLGVCSFSSGSTTTTTQSICLGLQGHVSWTHL
jgi:hypothetical protein